jgi:hypothetical protein
VAQGADLGLKLGLAAFLAAILAAAIALVGLLFTLLGVAAVAVLTGDARRRGAPPRLSWAALALVVAGFLALIVRNGLGAPAIQANQPLPPAAIWIGFAGEVGVAAAFYLAPSHLAADRSRLLLGLAFGAALAISGIVAWLAAAGPSAQLDTAVSVQGLPFILFAWAYATMLGRLRAQARADAPAAP